MAAATTTLDKIISVFSYVTFFCFWFNVFRFQQSNLLLFLLQGWLKSELPKGAKSGSERGCG